MPGEDAGDQPFIVTIQEGCFLREIFNFSQKTFTSQDRDRRENYIF